MIKSSVQHISLVSVNTILTVEAVYTIKDVNLYLYSVWIEPLSYLVQVSVNFCRETVTRLFIIRGKPRAKKNTGRWVSV